MLIGVFSKREEFAPKRKFFSVSEDPIFKGAWYKEKQQVL